MHHEWRLPTGGGRRCSVSGPPICTSTHTLRRIPDAPPCDLPSRQWHDCARASHRHPPPLHLQRRARRLPRVPHAGWPRAAAQPLIPTGQWHGRGHNPTVGAIHRATIIVQHLLPLASGSDAPFNGRSCGWKQRHGGRGRTDDRRDVLPSFTLLWWLPPFRGAALHYGPLPPCHFSVA
jgi:hypothetical protein